MKRPIQSQKNFKHAKGILPGGVNSPVRAFKAVGSTPLFIKRGKGSRIYDIDGNVFIDYVMSWGPLIHGHAPKGLLKALEITSRSGTSFGAPSLLEHKLGECVRTLIPSMDRIRFVSSGTEATMSAIRVARASTGRNHIVKFEGCYHGHSDSFLVKAGSGATTLAVPTSPGVPKAVANTTLLAIYNNLKSVEALFRHHPNKIASIIVEPIAGNMGVIMPTDGFLQGLRKLCTKHGAILVFDEVISGFRASVGGAQALLGVRPDLTCLGKIIGGGLPVGAYGGKAKLMKLVAPEGPVYQAGTLSGNPLAMKAGLWTLKNLTPKLYRDLSKRSSKLATGLTDLAHALNVPLQVNVSGSLLTPFFTSKPVNNYTGALAADTKAYALFFREMIKRGIYLPPSQFEAWFLSAAHTDRDIQKTLDAAKAAMLKVAKKIK